MQDRLKLSLLIGGAVFCIGLAGAMVHLFSGRWEETGPTTVAGPALTFAAEQAAPRGEDAGLRPAPRRLAYITGAVMNPGVYPLHEEDARVADLVAAAGGLRWDAAAASVNLAAPVHDGDHIDVKAASFDAGPRPRELNAAGWEPHSVAVNTADAEELSRLPGVSRTLAERIVEHRRRHGAFGSPESLLEVPGIGPAKLERFRSFLRF